MGKDFTKIELKDLYRKNNDFKDYADRYCTTNHTTLDVALDHKMLNYAAQNILGILKVGDSDCLV